MYGRNLYNNGAAPENFFCKYFNIQYTRPLQLV